MEERQRERSLGQDGSVCEDQPVNRQSLLPGDPAPWWWGGVGEGKPLPLGRKGFTSFTSLEALALHA